MLRSILLRPLAAATLAFCWAASARTQLIAQGQRDSIVSTMTGPVRKVERPTAIMSLQVPSVIAESPAVTLGQLLSGRFAGLQVMSTGETGTGSRIRIRGQSSLALGNDPLIVIDGVRLLQAPNDAEKPTPSRVDDINIDEIEEIEILSGPASTTLYGTGAANGVINITTKHGARGKTRLNAYAEGGPVTDPTHYPDLWQLWGKRTGQSISSPCSLTLVAAKSCSPDSLSHGNVLNVDSLTPIATGYRTQYGVQLSGGAKRVQFFVSGEREDETGAVKMPARDMAQLKAERGVNVLPANQVRPSVLARNSVRANVFAQPAQVLSLQFTSAYVNGDTRLLPGEISANALGYNTTGGGWLLGLRDALGRPLAGYASASAGDVMSQVTTQSIDRYINGVSATFTPQHWLSAHAAYGRDDAAQVDRFYVRKDEGPPSNSPRGGLASRTRKVFAHQNTELSASATFHVASWLGSKTSIGVQRITSDVTIESLVGNSLPAGATTPEAGFVYSSYSAVRSWKSTGVYFEQQFSMKDALFVTGGVRRDGLSAYGAPFDTVVYPSIGVSWLLSKHNFFSKRTWLNTLQLRSAYGTSGQSPTAENGIAPLSVDSTISKGHNRIEYSAEWESGASATMFNGASQIAVSYYNRRTSDFFVPIVSFSFPFSSTVSYTNNGGEVRNRGVEVSLVQRLISRSAFSASLSLTGATNQNRLISLPANVPPIFTGNRSTQKNTPGYPLFGLWGRSYSFSDGNQDGIITSSELTFNGDTTQFIGSSFPTRVLALSPSVELFNHKLRFNAQLDSKWGFKKFNNTLRHQCQSPASCRARNDMNVSLAEQAAAIATTQFATYTGMFEDGSFTRLREASIAYELPVQWANAVRASSWTIALTGRNLGVATNYSGINPEASVSTTDARQDEYFSTPLPRYYTLRLNVKF